MKVLSVFGDYAGLVRAIKERRAALGLSQLALDDLAGLQSGYTGKIEAMLTNPGAKNARAIGRESLPLLLGALGIELAVVPSSCGKQADGKQEAAQGVQAAPTKKSDDFLAHRARIGAAARAASLTPQRRRLIAQKAGIARHRRQKKSGAQECE